MRIPNLLRRAFLCLMATASGAVPACSGGEPLPGKPPAATAGERGRLDLNLVVGSFVIESVHLSLASPALPSSIERDIDTRKVGGPLKAFAGLLPVGAYTAAFTATATDGTACSGNAGPFQVASGAPAEVSVQVVCGSSAAPPPRGNLKVSAEFQSGECPYLSEVFVAPTEITGSGTIDVSAKISDPAGAVFTWSSNGGTFAQPSSPVTTFTVSGMGTYTVTATLTRAGCPTESVSTDVRVLFSGCVEDFPCFGLTARCVGTDQLQRYVESDNPDCEGAMCRTFGPPIPCPAGTVCRSSGPEIPFWGGQNGECVSEDGDGGSGGAGGSGGGGGVAGSSFCTSPTVLVADPDECRSCEQNNCDPPVAPGCFVFPAASPERDQCNAVLNCIRVSNCHALGALNCFCGPGVDIVSCKADLANATGVCKTQVVAGYPAGSTAAFIVDNSTRADIPAAEALALAQCDFAFCGLPELGGFNECIPYCQ